MKFYSLVTLLLISSVSFAQTTGRVIYGEDNRVDVFESTNSSYVELSKSTAAMISTSELRKSGNTVKIGGTTLEDRGMCPDERFIKQPTTANCSGFLVSDKYLVTAGHCIENESDCSKYSWVFDYKVDHATQSEVVVDKSAVYTCKKIMERSLDNTNKNDFAVIELDRAVTDRRPLQFRTEGQIAKGDEVVVIGHPTGLPTKIADKAYVRSHQGKYFVANLDTYGGNSGSAVFNAKTGVIEGILVRGDNDYVRRTIQVPGTAPTNGGWWGGNSPTPGPRTTTCMASNICPEGGCRGEDVTYITNIDFLKSL